VREGSSLFPSALEQLTASEKRTVESLLLALKPLTNLRSAIPLPYATTFLMVALAEGQSVNAYATAIGVNRFVMDRYIRGIGDRARNGGRGLGLVVVGRNPAYPNRRQVFLSPKGRALAKEILAQTSRKVR